MPSNSIINCLVKKFYPFREGVVFLPSTQKYRLNQLILILNILPPLSVSVGVWLGGGGGGGGVNV